VGIPLIDLNPPYMRTLFRDFAGQVSKYAKIGLVLFYVLQITVLFREHIVHFYKTALEAVHAEKDGDAALVATAHHVGDKHRGDEEKGHGRRLVAASSLPSAILMIAEEKYGHEPHPHHGHEKDRAGRHRRAPEGEWLIENLFSRIRNAPMPSGSETASVPTTMRRLAFAT